LENESVSAAVRVLAASKKLDALVKFIWDTDEVPLHEDMWFALRMGWVAHLRRYALGIQL
jgi:hypothetical protein